MKKIIILILISCAFYGCKSTKVTKISTKTDTIYKSEVVKITPPQLNSIIFDNICDSLTGLKPFNYTFVSGKAKGSLKANKNGLELTYNIDSLVDSKVNEFKSSYKTEKEVKEIFIKRPFNLYSIFLNIIFAMWIFRKPIFRLISPIKL